MNELNFEVVAICEAKNNGRPEKFERIIAAFRDPFQAEKFIDSVLPKERRGLFFVRNRLTGATKGVCAE